MQPDQKIYIAGHTGLVGSALIRKLRESGFAQLLYRSSAELDLRDQRAVEEFFATERPDFVLLAAAKVGGILANSRFPAEFIYDNLVIETNIIQNAYRFGVKKLLFLGSSCIYPKTAPQPIKEEYLLTGEFEKTNEPYAIAKVAGLKICEAYNRQYGTQFIAVMPTNLYGPNDNFHNVNSHVLAALLRRFHEAKVNDTPSVTIWGTGKVYREFLHVDDLADACIFLMQNCEGMEIINIGTGQEIMISDLANLIKKVVGYPGKLEFDHSKPDGVFRKLLDVSKLNQLGWRSKIQLENGLVATYRWYLKNENSIRK